MRNEAGGGDDPVPPVSEEAREGRPESVGVHRTSLPGAKTASEPALGPNFPRPGGTQPADMPTIGLFSAMPPADPKNHRRRRR